jgi:DNA modification methylase
VSLTVLHGDCAAILPTFAADAFDAIVTDPPYHLTTGKKGGSGEASLNPNSPAGRSRVTTGFMGKAWDGGAISHDVGLWRECLRVAKPGAYLLAFGGTRTFHRLTCAIEDAGWEIRDCLMWLYGCGFPKSLNLEGGLGTALKPAWEPIILARKPLGSVGVNVLATVESQLRKRGISGDIRWRLESVSGAESSKKNTDLGSTRHSGQPPTHAKTVAEGETLREGPPIRPSSGMLGTNGQSRILDVYENCRAHTTDGYEAPLLTHTAGYAPAAGNERKTSSQSTTSTEEEQSTESSSTERYTHNLGEADSLQDTECFAGIATGLTGSMATVLISRDSSGEFLWPKGLPKFVAGSPSTVAANVQEFGTGALRIDECRIGTVGGGTDCDHRDENGNCLGNRNAGQSTSGETFHGANQQNVGRFPANLLHDGSPEVAGMFPSGDLLPEHHLRASANLAMSGPNQDRNPRQPFGGDSGSAARFFFSGKATRCDREEGLDSIELVTVHCSAWGDEGQRATLQVDTEPSPPRVIGVSGAPNNDAIAWSTLLFGSPTTAPRLTGFRFTTGTETGSTTESKTLSWLALSRTRGSTAVASGVGTSGGNLVGSAEPSTPCLTTTSAWVVSARGVERAASRTRWSISASDGRKCDHPTVKPTALMRWLCRLVTPAGGTVLDPFAGSGSTGKACAFERLGFVGIEQDEHYAAIARARIAWADAHRKPEQLSLLEEAI